MIFEAYKSGIRAAKNTTSYPIRLRKTTRAGISPQKHTQRTILRSIHKRRPPHLSIYEKVQTNRQLSIASLKKEHKQAFPSPNSVSSRGHKRSTCSVQQEEYKQLIESLCVSKKCFFRRPLSRDSHLRRSCGIHLDGDVPFTRCSLKLRIFGFLSFV